MIATNPISVCGMQFAWFKCNDKKSIMKSFQSVGLNPAERSFVSPFVPMAKCFMYIYLVVGILFVFWYVWVKDRASYAKTLNGLVTLGTVHGIACS